MGCGRWLYSGAWMGLTVAACAVLHGVLAGGGPPQTPAASAIVRQAGGPGVGAVLAADTSEAPSTLDLTDLERHFEAVARRVAPSVVAISVALEGDGSDLTLRSDRLTAERLNRVLDRTTRTVGTGFFVSRDGHVLTNEHVIGEAQQIWVTLDSGKIYPAIVVGSDPRCDLAVLKIPAENTPIVEWAASTPVRRGQWVIALGNPYGMAMEGEMAMSVGVVSATDRSLPKLASKENRLYTSLIQTTAEINPGNSGGPLFNLTGQVIGINTAVVLPQKNTNGIGFAMPADDILRRRIDDLSNGREIAYGYLGVSVTTPSDLERFDAGLERSAGGVLVTAVESGSPADGRLRVGDVVSALGDSPIRDADAFVRAIGLSDPSTGMRLVVHRNGKPASITIMPARRDPGLAAINRERQRMRWNGMLLGPVPTNWTFDGRPRPQAGVMVLAADRSAQSPLPEGAVISTVAGRAVSSLADLQQILNSTPPELCSIGVWTAPPTLSASIEP